MKNGIAILRHLCAVFLCLSAAAYDVVNTPYRVFTHTTGVNTAEFSPDGKDVLAACEKTITIWNLNSSQKIAELTYDWNQSRARYSPDGTRIIAVASRPNNLGSREAIVWDIAAGNVIMHFDHTDRVYAADFTPDGSRIITVGTDDALGWENQRGCIREWDAATGELLQTIFTEGVAVDQLFLSPDGQWALLDLNYIDEVAGTPLYIPYATFWRTSDWTMLQSHYNPPYSPISIGFTPDSSCYIHSGVLFYSTADLSFQRDFSINSGTMRFSPDGSLVFARQGVFGINTAHCSLFDAIEGIPLRVYHPSTAELPPAPSTSPPMERKPSADTMTERSTSGTSASSRGIRQWKAGRNIQWRHME